MHLKIIITRVLAGTVLALVVLKLLHTPSLKALSTMDLWPISHSLQDRRICVADNICKSSHKDAIYYYTRKSDFNDLVDATIRYEVANNINHTFPVVPRIVHFIQYSVQNVNNFEFHHMLSVISASRFIKPDVIYFWMDMEPNGSYWKEIRQRVTELVLIQKERPTSIRGRPVLGITHVSDVIRIEAILEYGGIYLDLDVIVLKSLEPLMGYDVTMGYESKKGLCAGFIMAKPWTEFIRLWHQQYKTFDDANWGYHAILVPAMLAKKHPNLIHTEWKSINRPSWKELSFLYEEGNLYDWRRNNYVMHLWIRKHLGVHNATNIKTWNTTVGEIFRYIYYNDWRIKS